jgi:hypothetical protein
MSESLRMQIVSLLEKLRRQREQRNRDLLERAKNPDDNLAAYDPTATFFQPRPLIKKNQTEVAKIFGDKQPPTKEGNAK